MYKSIADKNKIYNFEPLEFNDVDTLFTFGKYKGKSLKYVLKHDVCYVRWASDKAMVRNKKNELCYLISLNDKCRSALFHAEIDAGHYNVSKRDFGDDSYSENYFDQPPQEY